MESASISICNQKGGVGKSSLTVLLASYLHYTLGHDVLVMDCDYPQWSVHAQRERELSVLENSKYYKLMLIRQFKATGRKLWPVIACTPTEAPERESQFLRASGYRPAIVLYDLPGTVNTAGVIEIFSALDCLFVPMKADKVVMGSTLSFARTFDLSLVQNTFVSSGPCLTVGNEHLSMNSTKHLSVNSACHCCRHIFRIVRNSIRNCFRTVRVSGVRHFWLRSGLLPRKRRSKH